MSSISSVGVGYSPEVASTPRQVQQPESQPASADKSLVDLQNLLQQIEGAANTRAIPAHQSW